MSKRLRVDEVSVKEIKANAQEAADDFVELFERFIDDLVDEVKYNDSLTRKEIKQRLEHVVAEWNPLVETILPVARIVNHAVGDLAEKLEILEEEDEDEEEEDVETADDEDDEDV